MSYKPDTRIKAALKKHLSQLLKSEDPFQILDILVQAKKQAYPTVRSYSILEDLVIQDIIEKHQDKALDELWTLYNVGYFKEDTEKYLKNKLGEGHEKSINVIGIGSVIGRISRKLQAA